MLEIKISNTHGILENTRIYIDLIDALHQYDSSHKLALAYTRLAKVGSLRGGRVILSDVIDATGFKKRTAKIYLQKLLNFSLIREFDENKGVYQVVAIRRFVRSYTGKRRGKYVSMDSDVVFSYRMRNSSEFAADVQEILVEREKQKQRFISKGFTATDYRSGMKIKIKDEKLRSAHDLASYLYIANISRVSQSTAYYRRKKQTLSKYNVPQKQLLATGCKYDTYNQTKEEVIVEGGRDMNLRGNLMFCPISRRKAGFKIRK